MSYKAEILADSISPNHCRLTTFQITFPRIVLAELNTHRMLSRNSASSRAIPTKKMIEMVRTNPFIPARFPKIGKGMQPEYWITPEENVEEYKLQVGRWLAKRDFLADDAEEDLKHGLGKQIINRPLETFMWHTVIVSATTYDNFFKLRCHPDAQLEIRTIAEMMQKLYKTSIPVPKKEGQWHLPLINRSDEELVFNNSSTLETAMEFLIRLSTVRCAKISYLRQNTVSTDGESLKKELELYRTLSDSGHWSPFEHCAMAIEFTDLRDSWFGNFQGWKQQRKFYSDESGVKK